MTDEELQLLSLEEKSSIKDFADRGSLYYLKLYSRLINLEELKMTFNNEIQQTKEDIAILQEKLKKLEELEIQKSKSPAEEAFYRIYSRYPDKLDDRYGSAWDIFAVGYNEAHKDAVENNKNFEPTSQEQENNEWRNVALRFGEELVIIGPCGYDDMTANDWLEWAKDAYGKNCDGWLKLVLEKQRKYEALTEKLQEKTVIEPTPPITNGFFEGNPPDGCSSWSEFFEEFIRTGNLRGLKISSLNNKVKEPKPPTLLHILCEWCDDDIDLPCGELVNMIEQWLPDEIYIEYGGAYERGWNDALRTIKNKLR
jgi:hypothetical protein